MIFSKVKHLLDFKNTDAGVLEKDNSGNLISRVVDWGSFDTKERYDDTSSFSPYDVPTLCTDFNPEFGVETGPATAYTPTTLGQNVSRWRDSGPHLNHALKIPSVPDTSTPVLAIENGILHVESNNSNHGLQLSAMVPFGPKTFYVVAKHLLNNIFFEWGFGGVIPGNCMIGRRHAGYLREIPYPERDIQGNFYMSNWTIICLVCGQNPSGMVSSKQSWAQIPFEIGYGVNYNPGLFARNLGSFMDSGSQARVRRFMCFSGAHSQVARKRMMGHLSAKYNIPIEVTL